ncbi:MAG TPA: helix-turn-helix domain-containing protein [Noviherbaspirillum sp.]|jgi:AcrR family transcriptional regulator|uniref:TetR/AcrR family transcriptional regulator n=1 Tax=Noviherbaspirillum sp. TaxID=1926288 RepID=UPI002F94E855
MKKKRADSDGAMPSEGRLSHDKILRAAVAVLEGEGRLTMRRLAQLLGVDPMAVYHYFPNKDALFAAVAIHVFGKIDSLRPQMERQASWTDRLKTLARGYMALVRGAPYLTRVLAGDARLSAEVSACFQHLFDVALGDLELDAKHRRASMNLLVDFIHGYAMANTRAGARWQEELAVIEHGIASLAAAARTSRPAR